LLCFSLLLALWRIQADVLGKHPVAGGRAVPGVGPSALVIRRDLPGAPLPAVLPVGGPPTLDVRLVNDILAAYRSPLSGHGADIVSLSTRYGIDDSVSLGFFVMESRVGTQGEALRTLSVGNMRPMGGAASLDGYRSYSSWLDGVAEWYRVIHDLYLNTLQLISVEAVVPVYAPSSDYNDPLTMIAGIRQLVSCWRGDAGSCPADPPGMAAIVARDWALPIMLPLHTNDAARLDSAKPAGPGR
jgi:hypothetical protein